MITTYTLTTNPDLIQIVIALLIAGKHNSIETPMLNARRLVADAIEIQNQIILQTSPQ